METTAAIERVCDPDLELAERHAHGDARAFEELYQRFAGMVYNLAFRLSGDAEEAADLAQEIFLRLFRHLGRFRGRASLKTWVYAVALNHCRSRFGRRKVALQMAVDEDGEPMEIASADRNPEELAAAQEASRRVQRALLGLPVVFREAVVLRDLEGLAYEEIATVTGVRVGTVRSRIARGREQLRLLLESER